ncbi:MAG: hypothetical protein R3B53_03985 [Candidatus Paceibacterota bacterium]
MNILFWGLTLGVAGKILVVLAVLHMHHSIVREHRIDRNVILTYRQERVLTFIGLILIAAGYAMEIYFYSPTSFFTCHGKECAAALGGLLN